MSINKVIYGGRTLIDLSSDTVTPDSLLKGVTAHKKDGSVIIGSYDGLGSNSDEIDRILTAGLTDGYKQFSDDGTIISTTDSQGRKLVKEFSNNFMTCTTTLYNSSNVVLGKTIKDFSNNSGTITTTDSKGQKLVKNFTNGMKKCESVLTDSSGKELARLVKTFSDDEKTISSVVTYGN